MTSIPERQLKSLFHIDDTARRLTAESGCCIMSKCYPAGDTVESHRLLDKLIALGRIEVLQDDARGQDMVLRHLKP